MTVFQAFIMGVVEGITEFLPVSSTGHLILTQHILGIPSTEFIKSFELAIQIGAICAIFFLYRDRLSIFWSLRKQIIFAFIPTGIIGLIAFPFIKDYLLGNAFVVTASLFLGGCVLLFIERLIVYFRLTPADPSSASAPLTALTWKKSIVIGILQSISMVPGMSRSALSIIGGLVVGLNRQQAVDFSFLIALPTIVVAVAYDLLKGGAFAFVATHNAELILAVGFFTSFVVAWASMAFFLNWVKNRSLALFGVYRIVVSFLFFFIFLY